MKTAATNVRQDYIDWLRVIAIFFLLLLHAAMPFVTFMKWHITNQEQSVVLSHLVSFLHTWRMPLLFFVSGFGTYCALNSRTAGQYAGERARKLFIPLVVGMLLIVPPQVYIEKIAQFGNVSNFLPVMYKGAYPAGNLSWHHLWFILYLFMYSLILIPFFVWFKTGKSLKMKDMLYRLCSKRGGVLLFVIPLLVVSIALNPFFPHETHALLDDWKFFTYYMLFFIFGFILVTDIRIKDSLISQRRFLLAATILVFVPWYSNLFIPWKPWTPVVYGIESIFLTWFFICTAVAYGARYLNFHNKFLKYANEAIYPFYILHQTVIVVIGYFIIQTGWSVGVKYLFINAGTLAICIPVYEFVIRRTLITRIMFGLKLKKPQKPYASIHTPVIAIADNR